MTIPLYENIQIFIYGRHHNSLGNLPVADSSQIRYKVL